MKKNIMKIFNLLQILKYNFLSNKLEYIEHINTKEITMSDYFLIKAWINFIIFFLGCAIKIMSLTLSLITVKDDIK